MKNVLLLALILLSLSLNGCWSYRVFDPEIHETPIFEHWTIIFETHDLNTYCQSDYVNGHVILNIEKKYLDYDSLKNEAIRVDSLELVAGGSVYKRINDKEDFEHARKTYYFSGYKYYSYVFQLKEGTEDALYHFPLISRNINDVFMIAYVSVKHPDDGRVESRKVKMKMTENAKTMWF